MRRTDTLKKAGFDVRVLREFIDLPILVVTSHLAADGVAADLTQILRRWADEVVAVEVDLRGSAMRDRRPETGGQTSEAATGSRRR